MKKLLVILTAAVVCGLVDAAEYTYNWDTNSFNGTYPTSILGGKITLQYTSENKIKKMTINSAAGDKFIFTGDKIFFTDSNSDKIATITNATSGTLVFQNDASCRTVYTYCPRGSTTWHGYNTFVGTDYTTIFANANVDDYEPVETLQDSNDETGKSIPSWSSKNTMFPHQIVREPGRITFQYQTVLTDSGSRKYVKVLKAELKQVGNDIKMRILGAYAVYSDASAPVERGFDVDTLWDGTEKVDMPIRTTGNLNNGYGINTVSLNRITPLFKVRFEGNVKFTGSPTVYPSTGIEVADVSKGVASRTYPQPSGGTLALLDGSVTGFNWIPTGGSGSGTFLFATTKPTSSPAVTNRISLTSEYKTTASFTVKGIDGYPMMLQIDHTDALPTSYTSNSHLYNGRVRVAENGILKLNAQGVNGTGLKSGKCDFEVEKGGILQQAKMHVFGHTSMVSLNGGKLQLSVDEPYEWDTGSDIPLLTLRNGALVKSVSSNSGKYLRIGRSKPGATWYVSGETPSTNDVMLQFYGPSNVTVTNTFNVAKLGDFDADFVCTKGIGMYTGTASYRTNVLRKVGHGTMLVKGNCTVPADTLIEGGTFKLGASNIWRGYETTLPTTNAGYNPDDPPPPIVLCGGTFAAAANTSNGLGKVTLTANSGIMLEEGSCFTCYDQSSVAWNANAQLDVTIPTNSVGDLLGAVRFGTTKNGLSERQICSIRLNGKRAILDDAGWLRYRSFGMEVIIR